MGLTYVDAHLRGPTGREADLRFLVDSGATYSVLPRETWEHLELRPRRTIEITLIDGTTLERSVSECEFMLLDDQAHSPVILGEAGDLALLGAVTLETLGLVLNPFTRTLHPMRMLLA